MSAQTPKTPKSSEIVMTELVLPNDTNMLGNLLGGRLMHWIDIAAALAAMKHAGQICVTASVDEINFDAPIRLGDVVKLYASVNRAFRTSMEVGVKTVRMNAAGEEFPVNTAYLTFVALDEHRKPCPVPPLVPETPEEQRRFEEAGLRREMRLRHRQQIQQYRQERGVNKPSSS
ncbi:MAG: acyl-CoA thioesterase [Bacteroidota bacterium]|nr:acyl-CoA thioesterase [Candidatus Kapabacteria bacterium]MDW8219269.1 acyl-CoA thioesterase [Bacteroidota bacterium]